MKLQTKIRLQPKRFNQIDYNSKVLLLGSCFSENIGHKFNYFKFQSLQNPFGILFQPLAIERLIANAINDKEYTEEDLIFYNEQWHCFDTHSRFSNSSKKAIISQLNEVVKDTRSFLKEASHIIITLGTAWSYRYIETDRFVANCHKIPQKRFLKELLSVDQISESLEATISLIKSVNTDVNFVFTVSPVRHIKDGFIENTLSKSHLISAIHPLLSLRAESRSLNYFPSYEIMMDELRDYRFYKSDMLHPSNLAVDYIWENFLLVWISKQAQDVIKDVDIIQKGLAHTPFNPSSEAHQKFLLDLEKKKQKLNSSYPHISF